VSGACPTLGQAAVAVEPCVGGKVTGARRRAYPSATAHSFNGWRASGGVSDASVAGGSASICPAYVPTLSALRRVPPLTSRKAWRTVLLRRLRRGREVRSWGGTTGHPAGHGATDKAAVSQARPRWATQACVMWGRALSFGTLAPISPGFRIGHVTGWQPLTQPVTLALPGGRMGRGASATQACAIWGGSSDTRRWRAESTMKPSSRMLELTGCTHFLRCGAQVPRHRRHARTARGGGAHTREEHMCGERLVSRARARLPAARRGMGGTGAIGCSPSGSLGATRVVGGARLGSAPC